MDDFIEMLNEAVDGKEPTDVRVLWSVMSVPERKEWLSANAHRVYDLHKLLQESEANRTMDADGNYA